MKTSIATLALACGLVSARRDPTPDEIGALETSGKEAHSCFVGNNPSKMRCLLIPGYDQNTSFGKIGINTICGDMDRCIGCVEEDSEGCYACDLKVGNELPTLPKPSGMQRVISEGIQYCHEQFPRPVFLEDCVDAYLRYIRSKGEPKFKNAAKIDKYFDEISSAAKRVAEREIKNIEDIIADAPPL
ncbi:hypothetical protein PCL_05193 [Purpureocillium lilacinum]|uniref:Uncharacterized protein n=1 Tax=Purpureocillium lilacinum TaxID=33203 RepID=A0A2U3DVF2_PURLI|nr:hypothetical protein PCL_05193 [Purpureocillium lilacinum]